MKKSKFLIVLAFFTIYIVWGSTYLFNKIAVTALPPFFMASLRFLGAGVLIMIISKIMKLNLKVTKKQLINCFVSSFFFLVYGNGVFVWALVYLDSGFAALLASTQPLFVLILLRLIDRKPMQTQSIIGVALGVLGMYLLVSQQSITASEGSLLGIFMILTCVLSWSYGGVFVSKADLPKNFFITTGYQMLFSGSFLFLMSLTFGETMISPLEWSTEVQFSLIMLIVFGSIIAFTAFNYLLKLVSTEKVATSAYVNPIVAMLLGWYFLDEVLTMQSIIASIVLLSGVYFITSRKRIAKVDAEEVIKP
ncbi:EamA family transporter [Polaribacter atrinae]|uniref:Multidrug transporter n=1 Tax=Polaribacter atrinae TaxID=1333662 RepID=A0A176SZS9_9FLAO|nr:EamA family transporter [Polaribacter atrinae]OAD40901.1 multidrug transporter [Polaribacter atrinae]